MSEDPPPIELWVLVAEFALVLLGAWVYEGGVVRWGEFLASWALPTGVLALVAGAVVPWTRGVSTGARSLLLTSVLGAIGALLTGGTMVGILVLSVIRTGLSTSDGDLMTALVTGGPSGAWLGAVAGLLSGAVLSIAVSIVEGALRVPPNAERPGWRLVVPIVALAVLILALVAEVQHWAPASLIAGCSAGCQAWTLPPLTRFLSSFTMAVCVSGGTWLLLDWRSPRWRAPAGLLAVAIGLVVVSLGHTVFTSTTGPRFRRATLGLPPMPLPLTRELVDAQVIEHPGILLHTVEARWPDGESEVIVIGIGPFRPDTAGLALAFKATAAGWQADAMPGRLDTLAPRPPAPPR